MDLQIKTAGELLEGLKEEMVHWADTVKIDNEYVTFHKDNNEIYWISKPQLIQDGTGWWINHLSEKVWFNTSLGYNMLINIRKEWGIK